MKKFQCPTCLATMAQSNAFIWQRHQQRCGQENDEARRYCRNHGEWPSPVMLARERAAEERAAKKQARIEKARAKNAAKKQERDAARSQLAKLERALEIERARVAEVVRAAEAWAAIEAELEAFSRRGTG